MKRSKIIEDSKVEIFSSLGPEHPQELYNLRQKFEKEHGTEFSELYFGIWNNKLLQCYLFFALARQESLQIPFVQEKLIKFAGGLRAAQDKIAMWRKKFKIIQGDKVLLCMIRNRQMALCFYQTQFQKDCSKLKKTDCQQLIKTAFSGQQEIKICKINKDNTKVQLTSGTNGILFVTILDTNAQMSYLVFYEPQKKMKQQQIKSQLKYPIKTKSESLCKTQPRPQIKSQISYEQDYAQKKKKRQQSLNIDLKLFKPVSQQVEQRPKIETTLEISQYDGAKAKIDRLQTQILRAQAERDALKIPDNQDQINNLIIKLNDLYKQLYSVKPEILLNQVKVAGFQKQLTILQRQNYDERDRVSSDKLKLTQINNLIISLQQKLKQAQGQRASYEVRISLSQKLVRQNSVKMASLRTTKADIDSQITYLQGTLDRITSEINTLELDLDRARTDLSTHQIIEAKLIDDIRGFSNRKNIEEAKLAEEELKHLKLLIDKLQFSTPNILLQKDKSLSSQHQTADIQNKIVQLASSTSFGMKQNSQNRAQSKKSFGGENE